MVALLHSLLLSTTHPIDQAHDELAGIDGAAQ